MKRARRMPAEWEAHRATWSAWPSDAVLWAEDLAPAQREFTEFCHAMLAVPSRSAAMPPETLELLVPDAARQAQAAHALEGLRVCFRVGAFGDIWLRDTAPSFQLDDGGLSAGCFRFNGWGGKYVLKGDEQVSARVCAGARASVREVDLVLEGGAIEVDGEGTCLTTRQCVLNANRNPGLDEAAASRKLREGLAVEQVVWIERGLANDHTDGHIDTLARFVAPGVVACMEPRGGDPNADVLREILTALRAAKDACGRHLEIVTVPSPGAVVSADGRLMPASYLNFYISNSAVVVPTYASDADSEAVERISRCFAGRSVVGVSALAILTGGGAFHCITQQEPLISDDVGA